MYLLQDQLKTTEESALISCMLCLYQTATPKTTEKSALISCMLCLYQTATQKLQKNQH